MTKETLRSFILFTPTKLYDRVFQHQKFRRLRQAHRARSNFYLRRERPNYEFTASAEVTAVLETLR